MNLTHLDVEGGYAFDDDVLFKGTSSFGSITMHQDDMDYEVGINREVETTENIEFHLEIVVSDVLIKKIKLTADSAEYIDKLGQMFNDQYDEDIDLDTKDFVIIGKDGPHPLTANSSFKSNGIIEGSTLRLTLVDDTLEEERLADFENDRDSGYGSVVEEESKKASVVSIKIEQESDKDESDDNLGYYDRMQHTKQAVARFLPAFRQAFALPQGIQMSAQQIRGLASESKPIESKPSEPSVLRPISSKRRIAPSAGEISALNWPLPQAVRAVNPFPETIQAWMMDFETNEPVDILDVQRSVFAAPIRSDLVHRVVTYERNMKRQGTHNSRTRSEVRGSTRKVQPQKGLGMARHGTRRAPQFVGGASAHGPVPRSHETQIQRKVWLMALRSVLSAKYAQDQLVIVDNLEIDSHKTGDLSRMLVVNGWSPLASTERSPSVMLMPFMEQEIPSELKNLEIASRNIPGVSIMNPSDAEVYEILRHQFLIMDRKALDLLEGILKPM
ncbi:54S ribosomal protein yml6, mitochondrial [Coemansia furcata]|uniref:54S ribosomal protein yml6, mitochondrial n=1 Tax=Coemansia furcata TaxID=417177 RepID=A0ACC1LRL6_9FUNG|nr:54S ribosomal protein yml6, mitochondrial [Coemansia furcata]